MKFKNVVKQLVIRVFVDENQAEMFTDGVIYASFIHVRFVIFVSTL